MPWLVLLQKDYPANSVKLKWGQRHHKLLAPLLQELMAGLMPLLLHRKKAAIEVAASVGGSFLETLTSSDFYKKTKVQDISGSFRWAPFLALQSSDSFLTMLLLLSKYRMKSLPVVDLGEGKIENIITQAAVVHMLEECVGLHWFESWGTKKLFELGLPINSQLIKVSEEESVLKAFQLMRKKKRIGALPVVDRRKKAIGNISIRDVQYLLTAPEIFKDYRSITTKDFITTVQGYLKGARRRCTELAWYNHLQERQHDQRCFFEAGRGENTANLCCRQG